MGYPSALGRQKQVGTSFIVPHLWHSSLCICKQWDIKQGIASEDNTFPTRNFKWQSKNMVIGRKNWSYWSETHIYFVHRYSTKQHSITGQPHVRGTIASTPIACSPEFPREAQLKGSLAEEMKEKEAKSGVISVTTEEEETTQTPRKVSYNKVEQTSLSEQGKVQQVKAKT